jgi:hypothetical protein
MKIINAESNEALVFGINPFRKSMERINRKVRVDIKRTKFYTYRKIKFGEKIKVVNTNPFNLSY